MVEYVQNFLHRCSNKRVVEDNAGDVPEAALSVCRPVGSIPHVRVVTHFLNCGFEYLFGICNNAIKAIHFIPSTCKTENK